MIAVSDRARAAIAILLLICTLCSAFLLTFFSMHKCWCSPQGCCEHLVTIRDVCLVHPDHVEARLKYPHRQYTSYTRRRECNICTTRLATKVPFLLQTLPVFA